MKTKHEKPEFTEYLEMVDGKRRSTIEQYEYDTLVWKIQEGKEISWPDKRWMREWAENKEQKQKNGGLTDREVEHAKLDEERFEAAVAEQKSIDRICDAIQFFAPFIAYGILKTGVNAIKKINR